MKGMPVCSCKTTAAIAKILGAPKMAEMHEKRIAHASARDNEIHLSEEDRVIIPVLMDLRSIKPWASDREVREARIAGQRITDDHVKFRAQMAVFGNIVNEEMFAEHARYEDTVVTKFLGFLLEKEQRTNVRGRARANWDRR